MSGAVDVTPVLLGVAGGSGGVHVDSAVVRRAVVLALDALGVGEWADGVTPTGTLPLLAEVFMPAKPDRVIVVSVYDEVTDDPSPARAEEDHAAWQVQVRVRDRSGDVDTLAEDVRRALEGHHITYGAVRVARCRRTSFGPMGTVDGLSERADNYEVTAGRS